MHALAYEQADPQTLYRRVIFRLVGRREQSFPFVPRRFYRQLNLSTMLRFNVSTLRAHWDSLSIVHGATAHTKKDVEVLTPGTVGGKYTNRHAAVHLRCSFNTHTSHGASFSAFIFILTET